MPMFRKKPVVVEAVRFTDQPSEIDGPEPQWYSAAHTIDRGDVGSVTYADGTLRICTLEGEMTASPGDWIVRGIKGEIYPCKPDIFAATYELVQS